MSAVGAFTAVSSDVDVSAPSVVVLMPGVDWWVQCYGSTNAQRPGRVEVASVPAGWGVGHAPDPSRARSGMGRWYLVFRLDFQCRVWG